MSRSMLPAVMTIFVGSLTVAMSGCATLSKEATQPISVRVFDLSGRSVSVPCRMSNGFQTVVGNSPMMQVPVSRSGSDLIIECQWSGAPLARAVVVSRPSIGVGVVLQPLATTVVDHLSGHLYDYPDRVDLVIGREVVFDRSQNDGKALAMRPLPVGQFAGDAGLRELGKTP